MSNFLNSGIGSRGLRNNNPGNLRMTNIKWQGKIPNAQNTDGAFEQFTDVRFGIRALIKDISGDIKNKGLNTIQLLINAYAPGSDGNNVNAYVNHVSSYTGIPITQIIGTSKSTIMSIVKAIVAMELGSTYASKISQSDYNDAWWMHETGGRIDSGDLPNLVIDAAKKTCKYCGHVIVAVALFFFTCYALTV